MARLLRVSLQGVRCSRLVSSPALVSLRELQLLKPPESKQIARRWFGESAAVEESCSSTEGANDTTGASMVANQGEDSAKRDDGVEKKGVLKEASITNDVSQPEGTAESSPKPNSDKPTSLSLLPRIKLTSSILGKMRGKTDTISGPKDNGVQTQTEPHSVKANTPQDESSKSVQDDKWEQVMSSIRKMAAKKGSTKRKEGENQDDFADLDLSQAGGEAGISKSSNKPNKNSLATDALGKDCIANNKQKDDRFQSWNQQKAKEAKPVSFNFLKSLDVDRAMTRAETSADKSPSERVNGASTRAEMQYKSMRDAVSSITPKDNSLQGWIQQRSKETKPVNLDFLKSPEANSGSPQAKMQYKSPPKINEAIPGASSDNVSVPYSGYTVCIRNLPGPSNLALVKDALSIHGEVIGSFKKPSLNGSCAVYIEFKTAEAMDGALAARWLQLYSKAFTIVRADLPITTVVRLSKVNGETTESQLLSICGTYGSLDTIRRRGKGVYDVFYKVRELPNISKILDSLNEVTLNRSRWVALPAPTLHPSVRKEVLRSSEGQAWHVSQVNQTLNRIEVGLGTVSVSFEDLKALTSMEDELLKK